MKNLVNAKFNTFKKPTVQKILIGLYVLVVLGISATVRAETNQNLRTYKGEVVVTLDEKVYLVNANKTHAVQLRSSSQDLKEFNGMNVELIGEELKHMVGPVVTISSMDPLQMDEARTPAVPVVLVFEIGVVKHLGVETK